MMATDHRRSGSEIREFPRPAIGTIKSGGNRCELVCHASRELHMKWIAVFYGTGGFTARLVSRYGRWCRSWRSRLKQKTRRRMALIWGALPRMIQMYKK